MQIFASSFSCLDDARARRNVHTVLMSFHISPAGIEAVETIVEHRRAMFSDMGYSDEGALDAMCAAFRPWLEEKMWAGEYLAWVATTDGRIVAGLGLWLMDWPPHLVGPGSRRGNILNVYTHPECRKQGMARALMETALDWCRTHQIACVILHASAEGRPLYEGMGFQATNELRLLLQARSNTSPAGCSPERGH
jgi:GNAT superfamily N-acetyltransferase